MATYTASQATDRLVAEGFDRADVDALMGSMVDTLAEEAWDDEQQEWLVTEDEIELLRSSLDIVNPWCEVTITFRPHRGDAVTRTDTWAGWVTLARQWWENVSDKDTVAAELGAPGYDFESIYHDEAADDDAVAEWYATQAAAVTGWLGTYRGIAAWAGWDKQPATIKLDR